MQIRLLQLLLPTNCFVCAAPSNKRDLPQSVATIFILTIGIVIVRFIRRFRLHSASSSSAVSLDFVCRFVYRSPSFRRHFAADQTLKWLAGNSLYRHFPLHFDRRPKHSDKVLFKIIRDLSAPPLLHFKCYRIRGTYIFTSRSFSMLHLRFKKRRHILAQYRRSPAHITFNRYFRTL
jgi:hypothetical protein